MSQRSIRFPDDVEQQIQEQADALQRSFSWVVVSVCREELPAALKRAPSESSSPSRADAFRAATRKPKR